MARFSLRFIALCLGAVIGIYHLRQEYLRFETSDVPVHSTVKGSRNDRVEFGTQITSTNPPASYASKLLNKVFLETCDNTTIIPDMPVNHIPMGQPVDPYQIVLLVSFNKYQYYEAVPYIELLYRDYFQSILYCGPSEPPEHMIINFQMSYVMFELESERDIGGAYIYNCMVQAINKGYDARGILYMSDDVILKVESIREYNWNEIWLADHWKGHNDSETTDLYLASFVDPLNQPKECYLTDVTLPCNKTLSQGWFAKLKGRILMAQDELLEKSKIETERDDQIFTNFLQFLEKRSGGKKRFFKAIADIYYLPKAYWNQFHKLAEVFLKHKLYMEIAVPTILHGLEKLKNHPTTLIGYRHHDPSVVIPIFFNNTDWYAWHPFKLGLLLHGDSNRIQVYCSLFHAHWYRHPRHIK
ncbi:unnamed protein product [Owenia fusiformis]|uniref:Uncharacterized protein n=1 Tax=Owenia fusiformis TaxID=6347 RepID=A0A8S4Q861_OWEFU|nr:unnamed protein product [Owenia fusiformis]